MKSRISAAFAVAMVAALALCLVGCDGNNAQQRPEEESESVEASNALVSQLVEKISESIKSAKDAQNLFPYSLGQVISTDDYEYSFTEAKWVHTDEDNGWAYESDENGRRGWLQFWEPGWVFEMRGTFFNKSNTALNPDLSLYGQTLINGEYEYGIDLQCRPYDVLPLTNTGYFVLYTWIPDAMKERFTEGELWWAFNFDSDKESRDYSDFDARYTVQL